MGSVCGGDAHETKLQEYLEHVEATSGCRRPSPQADHPLDPEAWKPFSEINISAVGADPEVAVQVARWAARILEVGGRGPHPLKDLGTSPQLVSIVQNIFGKYGTVRTFAKAELELTKEQWEQLDIKEVRHEFCVTVQRPRGVRLGVAYADRTVTAVTIGSPAMEAGLGPGMTLLSVDGTEIADEEALRAALYTAHSPRDGSGGVQIRVQDRPELRITGIKGDAGDWGAALADTLERNKGQIRVTTIAGRPVTTEDEAAAAVASAPNSFAVGTVPALTRRLEVPELELFSVGAYHAAEDARARLRALTAAREATCNWVPLEGDALDQAASVALRVRALPPGGDEKQACTLVEVTEDGAVMRFEEEGVGEVYLGNVELAAAALEYAALTTDGQTLEGQARNTAAIALRRWLQWSERSAMEFKTLSLTPDQWSGLSLEAGPQGVPRIASVGPAAKAGATVGMLIKEVQGTTVTTPAECTLAVGAGSAMVRILAGGSTLQRTLRERAAGERLSALASSVSLPASPTGSPAGR